ncbi:hypothetical protein GCM10027595_00340 [Corynebacterium nasicanis]
MLRRGEKADEVLATLRGSSGVPPIKPPPGKPPVALGGPEPEPLRYLEQTVARVADDSEMFEQVSMAVRPKVPSEVFTTFAIAAGGTWTDRLWRIEGEHKDKPHLHEWATFVRLAENGHEVVILPRTDKKSPDALIDGYLFDAKTPTGSGNNTINNQLKTGRLQASRLVIDLLQSDRPISQVLDDLKLSKARYTGKLLEVIVIGRNGDEVRFEYE